MAKSRCIRYTLPKVIELSERLGYSPARTALEIEDWQDKTNSGWSVVPTMEQMGMQFIPWSRDKELYKKYNLLNVEGSIKELNEKEAKKWAETNNGSPEYYFEARQNASKKWVISIAKRLWSKKNNDEQLSLFDEKFKTRVGVKITLSENTNSVAYLNKVIEDGSKLAPLAKRLLEKSYAVPIIIVDEDHMTTNGKTMKENNAAGVFEPSLNKIFLVKEANLKYGEEHTIIHEILHAMSHDALRTNTDAAKRFQKIYNFVKANYEFTDEYPIKSIDEFLVGVFTNPNFVLDLKELPAMTSIRYKNLWEEVLDFFRNLLRIEKKNETLFEQVFAIGTEIIDVYDQKNKSSRELSNMPDEAFFDEIESQESIYKELLKTKAAVSQDEKTYIVNGEQGYRRVSTIIQKKRNLDNLDTSTSQALGDIFHAVAANTIASYFPEFNTHYKPVNIDGLDQATVDNINAIVLPIVNRAKAEGSVLIVELPIASSKRKIAGTIDLLEITADKKLRMLDYKTSLHSKNATTKFKKVQGNSDQQQIYKEILSETDEFLGRKGRKMEYQELMYIKASNKKGIRYQVVEKIPILYQVSKNASRNKMLSALYEQIEDLIAKKNKTNADRIDRIVNAKRELMIKIQKDVSNEELLQDAIADIAAIENDITSSTDANLNYANYRNDLDMYKRINEYIKMDAGNTADKALLRKVAGQASILYQQLYDDASDIFVNKIAKDLTFEGSPIESSEDVLKPIADINAYQAHALGASYSQNPIVIGTYKIVQERLATARKKAMGLGKEIKDMVQELKSFTGKTGDSVYDMFIQTYKGKKTGYLVQEYKSDFYQDAKQAAANSDLAWFSENATFNAEKYNLAKTRYEEYLSMSFDSTKASKLAYIKLNESTKNLTSAEQEELAEKYAKDDNQKALAKWVSDNKTIVKYNTPKVKWKDPKWLDIKEGKYKGTVVERFYDMYTNIMKEVEETGLPFYVSENFIPDFKKSMFDKLMNNGVGNLKIGESLMDALSIKFDEAEINKINPFTGQFIRSIPVLGKRKVFENSDEKDIFIQSEKSYDLGYSLAVFYESALRHQELKSIETTIEVAKALMNEQKEKLVSSTGDDIQGGFDQIKTAKGLDDEIKRFEYFIDATVYGKTKGQETGFKVTGNGLTQAFGLLKKGQEAIVSHSKLLDSILKYTGLNNIGYNLYSPVTNLLGGKSMQLLMGVGGRWYDVKDYNFGSLVASAGPFSTVNEDVVKANKFVEMLNPEINEFVKEEFDKTKAESKLLHSVPGPFSFMRWTEDHMHKAGLIAMIKSNKHSIKWDDWKIINGKLEYVGENKPDEGVLESFRQKVIHVNARALGNMNPDDKILLKKWFLGRAIIQHRGWIPAMLQTHWSSRRYDYQLQEYVEGRFNSLGKYIFQKSLNWNKLDEIEKANVKEALAEISIILGATLLLSLMKGGDDDEEKRKKLAYFIRTGDRYLAEMTFFTPLESSGKYQILISPAPAVSSIENAARFLNNSWTSVYGDTEDAEKAQKRLTKSAKRLIPFYSQGDRFINEVFLKQLEDEK